MNEKKNDDFFKRIKRIKNLSEQQKAILTNVCDRWINTKGIEKTNTKELNWEIARKFNKNGSRIDPKKPYLLTNKHYVSMGRSLKNLRERELIYEKDYTGIGEIALSEEGRSWCEVNIDGFKEIWEKERRERREKRGLMRTERIREIKE